jgi:hypothetical protein
MFDYLTQALQHQNDRTQSAFANTHHLRGMSPEHACHAPLLFCLHAISAHKFHSPVFQRVQVAVVTSRASKPPAQTLLAMVLLQTGEVLDTTAASTVHPVTEQPAGSTSSMWGFGW